MSTRWIIGDAFEEAATLPPASIDAVVMHPPYFLLTDERLDRLCGLGVSMSDYLGRLRMLIRDLRPALKPDAMIAFAMGDTPRARSVGVQGMAWRLALGLEADGWTIRDHALWSNPAPDWLFVMGGRKPLHELPPYMTSALETVDGCDFGVWPESVVDVLIRATCPEGGTVLDPFAGTGTTGRVAERLGCDVVLIEKIAAYADTGKQLQEVVK